MSFKSQESLESFVTMCDELMIPAEESIKSMNITFENNLRKIRLLKEEINKTNDTNKQKSIIQSCIKELQNAYNQIQKMDESTFDKVSRGIIDFIKVGVSIASGLAVGFKTKSVGAGIATSIGSGIAIGVSSSKISEAKFKKGGRLTKPIILGMIEDEIEWYERYLKILSDPKYTKYIKNGKGTGINKLESAYTSYGDDIVSKTAKEVLNYIKSIIEPYAMKKHGLNLQWMCSKDDDCHEKLSYTIHPTKTSDEKIESIYIQKSQEGLKLSDISDKFTTVIANAIKKFKLYENNLNIEEEPDSYCTIYIERSYEDYEHMGK